MAGDEGAALRGGANVPQHHGDPDRLAAQLEPDPKLGAAFHVAEIFQRKEAGLRWKFQFTPPPGFTARPDTLLFEIDRVTQQQEWDQMLRTPILGIYFDPKGLHPPPTSAPGTIAVQRGAQVFQLRFFLLVLPAESG